MKLFVITTAIALSITSGFDVEEEQNIGPTVDAKPDVVWDNSSDTENIKDKITTDVHSAEIKFDAENAPVAATGAENVPRAEGENVPLSGGENAPQAEGGIAPKSEGDNATKVEGENAPIAEGANATKAEGENAPIAEGANAIKTEGESAPTAEAKNVPAFEGQPTKPSDIEKSQSPQSATDIERKEPRNAPNLEPVEVSPSPAGPENATEDSQNLRHSTFPPPSTVNPHHNFSDSGEHHPPGVHGSFPPPPTIYPNHPLGGPGEHHPPGVHDDFLPPPPTIYPNHSMAGPGEHHPPGVHDHYDEGNNATQRNFPILHPFNPRQNATKPPITVPNRESPLSKITGFIKGFFGKIISFFK